MTSITEGKKKYPIYKPSYIDWIGDIPENWRKWKISHLFKVDRGRVIDKTQISVDQNDDHIYPVFSSQTQNNGCLGYIETYDYDKDSITWTTDGANAGSVFYRQGKFNATNVCGILTMINKNQSYEYLTYCIRVAALNNRRVDILGYKLMSNEMASIRIPLPPITEQQSVANYLDDKTTKIDQAISLKKQQIELLKEKKTAMINQAVTKGLDSNIEMIDSEIERIGNIPKGWEVRKLKYCLEKLTDGSHTSVEILDVGLPYVTVTNIYEDREYIDLEDCKKISQIDFDQLVRNGCKPKIGDILFSQIGTIGLCVEVKENDDFVMLSSLAILSPNNNIILNRFIIHFLRSYILKQQRQLLMVGGAVKRITLTHINNFDIIIPPLLKQKDIVNYLDCEIVFIDQTITTVQHSIDLLVEYKQSLISHVVTGKVKVF